MTLTKRLYMVAALVGVLAIAAAARPVSASASDQHIQPAFMRAVDIGRDRIRVEQDLDTILVGHPVLRRADDRRQRQQDDQQRDGDPPNAPPGGVTAAALLTRLLAEIER